MKREDKVGHRGFSDLPIEQQSSILRYSIQGNLVRGTLVLRQTSRQLHSIIEDP